MAWLTGWFSRIFKLIVQKTNRRGGAAKASIHEPFILNYECEQKIGIVTGGGDCPGLNAVIGAVVGYLSLWSLYWIFKLLTLSIPFG